MLWEKQTSGAHARIDGEDALPAVAERERLELSVDGAHFRPAAVGTMDDRDGVSVGRRGRAARSRDSSARRRRR